MIQDIAAMLVALLLVVGIHNFHPLKVHRKRKAQKKKYARFLVQRGSRH